MDLTPHLPILQVIVPLLLAPLVVLLQPKGTAWAAATAGSVLSFAVAITMTSMVFFGDTLVYELGGWAVPYGIGLQVDQVSALVLLVVTGASSVALLAGRESINAQIEAHRQPLFFSAWLLQLAGLAGMVVSADAFNIFVFMEISSLAAYILISGGPDRRALLAVFKYLIMGTIGATFYLIGVGLIYIMTGTLNLEDMARRMPEVSNERPILIAAGFITIGMGLKAALFPLHVWLPNAYMHAPHAVTVFLAACGTKVAVYVLFRFDFFVFQTGIEYHAIQFSVFLMPLALLGITVASAVAMFEGQLKRVLAFSSVAQVGYILLGASLLSQDGVAASMVHMINHALAKGVLFLTVACFAMRQADLRIDGLAGVAKTMPLTAAMFVIGGLSLIGIPGTAGFISKWLLINALLEEGLQGLIMVVIVLVSSLMALVYVWRIVEVMYFRAPVTAQAETSGPPIKKVIKEAPVVMLLVTMILAVLNIYFGLQSDFPVELSRGAADVLLRGPL